MARASPPSRKGPSPFHTWAEIPLHNICEWRSGWAPGLEQGEFTPIPLEDLVACLRRLRKSVDFWTKQAGRQGYMQYIEQYVG